MIIIPFKDSVSTLSIVTWLGISPLFLNAEVKNSFGISFGELGK